jgi:hypothetical protein
MYNKTNRVPPWAQVAAVSLVALVACALAKDAHAHRLPTEPSVGEGKLSTSIAAIAERVRAIEPKLLPQLLPKPKMAFRN